MDQGSHLASFGSFLAKKSESGDNRTELEGKKVTLFPPLYRAAISEIRPAELRESRKAVFVISNASSLQSTLIAAAASSTLARDQEIGLGGDFGR